jgi:hypothetical protein
MGWAMNPFPPKIQGIQMGQPLSSVVTMIQGSGDHEVQPQADAGRSAVIWAVPESLYYKRLSFRFTEKDRLYLIRFDLKDISPGDLRALKKLLFEKYGISWDEPWRLKVKDEDVLLYGPPDLGKVYYFEFSNRKTGEKAMELLEREMSAFDRAAAFPPKPEKEGQSLDSSGCNEDASKEPADESAKEGPTTQVQPRAGAPEADKTSVPATK